MLFLNENDIEMYTGRFAAHPALGPATRFLTRFKDEVNRHSDGWPYWSAPVRAAAKLMGLIERGDRVARGVPSYRGFRDAEVTLAEVKAALVPIKTFMTRRGTKAGMTLPALD